MKQVVLYGCCRLYTNRKIPIVKNTSPAPTQLRKKIASIPMRGWQSISLNGLVKPSLLWVACVPGEVLASHSRVRNPGKCHMFPR